MKNKLIIALALLFGTVSAQYTKLYDLNGNNGMNPSGDLYFDGTFLNGMTRIGGANSSGTIFRIKPDGTSSSKIFDFGASAASPRGSLFSDGIYFYGMTNQGGANSMGAIFKVTTSGSGFVSLFSFSAVNGNFPTGSLVSDGTYLYGSTNQGGGGSSAGVIFKIKKDGTGFSKLYSFSVTADGKTPSGTLYYDGTDLYGSTAAGGTNNMGTLFKIKTDGTGFTKLFDFDGATSGANPRSLISDGTYLYGMSVSGGAMNLGVVFKIMKDGSNFTKLGDFAGSSNGSTPTGALVLNGNMLYGMTSAGGDSDLGAIFKISTNGTDFSKLFSFNGATNGSTPYGSLTLSGSYLYGMTNLGGVNDGGVIFKLNFSNIGTGIAETTLESAVGVFPNPTSKYLSFETPHFENAKVLLFDVTGREVIAIDNYQSKSAIDVSGLSPGAYTYRINKNNIIYSGKWFKSIE
jgi:uncharacterized repeat protein (TIGR03803 family)